MNDDIYSTGSDSYIDSDTGILKNKLGLSTQAELDDAESDIASVEIVNLTAEDIPIIGNVNFGAYKDIHRQIFHDIYDWAGEVRTINITKDSTRFCEYQHIEIEGARIFKELLAEDALYGISDNELYVKRLSYYYSELNMLHPFREGNGRALRTFLSVLVMNHGGHIIAWDRMDPVENIAACVYAYSHDESRVERLLAEIIEIT